MSTTLLERPDHSPAFRLRRFVNWFPMGLTYAFLYMARYNLTVSKNALGEMMSKSDFGIIFAAGTFTYAFAFLINGPLTDRIGGKRAILIGSLGAAIANIAMGVIVYGLLMFEWSLNLPLVFSLLYACNMYFQSYGAVAIVKVNASWFHVRERGVFGGIFGVLISLGLYFAFDWGEAIIDATKASASDLSFIGTMLRSMLGATHASIDQTWWIFFLPAFILLFFFIIEIFILRDRPGQAGYDDFETGDASAGEADTPFHLKTILVKILTNPILLTIAFIEFCSGIMRNGIMHWYKIFSNDVGYLSSFIINTHWGLFLMIAGVTGGIFAGFISDKIFGSRRGPVAALLYGVMLLSTIAMWPLVRSTTSQLSKGIEVQVSYARIAKMSQFTDLSMESIDQLIAESYHVTEKKQMSSDSDSSMIFMVTKSKNSNMKLLATKIGSITLGSYDRFNKYQQRDEHHEIKLKDVASIAGVPSDGVAYSLGFLVVFMSLCVIGVHGMLSGTATADFGGRKAAATAVGFIDGFVYLGTAVQSITLGFLTEKSWNYWPIFLIPFVILGLVLAIRIWHAFPNASRKK
ncbi:MFS transporter [candidate division KSB1 bacterium]|nr:MFS transporter [candidate division KSB1 bacterium]